MVLAPRFLSKRKKPILLWLYARVFSCKNHPNELDFGGEKYVVCKPDRPTAWL